MENRKVGYLILGIAVIMVIIIFLFNSTMKEIVDATCSSEHGSSCPMYTSILRQTYLALSIVGILIIIGLFLVFSKPEERIVIKKVKEKIKKKKIDTSGLRTEEKQVLKIVQKNKAIFQADLIEKTGFGKAKMTRILDRLEGNGIVERKRRGMTNIVIFQE